MDEWYADGFGFGSVRNFLGGEDEMNGFGIGREEIVVLTSCFLVMLEECAGCEKDLDAMNGRGRVGT
jgi:hypothetical protein